MGKQCTLHQLTDHTSLAGVADVPEGHAAIQRNLNRLEKWTNRNLRKLSKGKCKLLLLGNKAYAAVHTEDLPAVKQLCKEGPWCPDGLQANCKPAMHFPSNRGPPILDFIRQNIGSTQRDVILPFCRALMKPHLKVCVQSWAPQFKKDMDLMYWVQYNLCTGVYFIWGEARRAGTVQSREQKA